MPSPRWPTLLAVLASLVAGSVGAGAQTLRDSIVVDGRQRSFLVHLPLPRPSARLPVVLALHGGGSDGAATEALTKFSDLANAEGILVAYPDAVDRNWNDGRRNASATSSRLDIDDVKFIAALLDTLAARYRTDSTRVYATGISNGAIFSHFLGVRLAPRIAAIAPVVGGVADEVARDFHPARPVSVLIMQGTADPLVPYNGGPIAAAFGGAVAEDRRGRIVSTDTTLALWLRHDAISALPVRATLPNRVLLDGCRAHVVEWRGGKGGSEVVLYRLEGGGHTWPGGAQYLPRALIGPVCRDFDATQVIWRFFAGKRRT